MLARDVGEATRWREQHRSAFLSGPAAREFAEFEAQMAVFNLPAAKTALQAVARCLGFSRKENRDDAG